MNSRSSSGIFLTELVIAVAVFAVCAAVCAAIFTDAFLTSEAADDLNNALVAAKNGAECYRAYGSAELAARALGGAGDAKSAAVYYDGGWRVCGEAGHAYRLLLAENGGEGLSACELSVQNSRGEVIIAFAVAKGGGA